MRLSISCLIIIALLIGQCIIINAQSLYKQAQIAPDKQIAAIYPEIVRLGDDRLLCAYSLRQVVRENEYRVSVIGIFSKDNGTTWGDAINLIEVAPDLSYDVSIVVNGTVVVVSATVVPPTHGSFVSTSRTLAVRSEDNGKSWSGIYEIPMKYRYVSGKVNPGITLVNGISMFAYAGDTGLQDKEQIGADKDQNCIAGIMISTDECRTWIQGPEFEMDKKEIANNAINGLDEPAIINCPDGSLYILFRTGFDRLYESRSSDNGKTWTKPAPSLLISHNAPAALCAIAGERPGILAVWNNSKTSRWPLSAAMSFDNGRSWTSPRVIAEYPGYQSSYPGCIQAADGTIVVVWHQDHPSRSATIEMTRFSLEWLLP